MTDPMIFIEKTKEQYPGIDLVTVRKMFEEVKEECRLMEEAEKEAAKVKAAKKAAKKAGTDGNDKTEDEA